MHTISTEARQKGFYLSLLTSLVFQSACLLLAAIVHSSTHAASPYIVIPLMDTKPVFYQRSRVPLERVNVKWNNVRVDRLRTLRGPNLPRKSDSPGHRPEEAAPLIGNPEIDFAPPLTLSLDQPSKPPEIRVGDFGTVTSDFGSVDAGHGKRNGFSESGFGGGSSHKLINWKPARIISKPTPAYTEDARRKHIEGDMLLDVIFAANSRIVVLRIIRSIGYGLDEMGVEAASQIVFLPATENGQAVDCRARVRVEFRLVPFTNSPEGDSL